MNPEVTKARIKLDKAISEYVEALKTAMESIVDVNKAVKKISDIASKNKPPEEDPPPP